MTSTTSAPPVLTIEELANAYCLFMANAYRLIEDGERLAAERRHLGAVGSFQTAVEEIVRGHVVEKAVVLEENDLPGWQGFWTDLNTRARLLEILSHQIHREIYDSEQSRADYAVGITLLPLDFSRTRFDGTIFLPPGGDLAGLEDMEKAARAYYKYVMGLFNAFNFFGLPNPASQLKTFWGIRAAARNQSLVR